VRLGVIRSFWFAGLDPEVERLTNAALLRLREAGAELVDGELPDLPRLIALITDPVQNHDVRPSLTRYLAQYNSGISFEQLLAQASPDVRKMIEPAVTPGGADFVPEAQYQEILTRHRPALRLMYQQYFAHSGVTAIVFPTTILAAPKIGEEDMQVEVRGQQIPLDEAISRNIAPASTAGLPALVLPSGMTAQGLPVALEFDGAAKTDRQLLALGVAFEKALGSIPAPP
jgi:mandelamide amidase